MLLREKLIADHPEALAYAHTLRSLPEEISGIQGAVRSLAISPIKSLGMLPLEACRVGQPGLSTQDRTIKDRAAMIAIRKPGVTVGGEAYDYVRLSQREAGCLVLAKPRYKSGKLMYEAPDITPISISPEELEPRDDEPVAVRILGKDDVRIAVKEHGRIIDWVRELLYKFGDGFVGNIQRVEVLLPHASFERPVTDADHYATPRRTLFSDGGQVHAASSSTLEWINVNLERANEPFTRLPMAAFRPNIEIEGLPPNVEDVAAGVMISGTGRKTHAEFGRLCTRCAVTNRNPETGKKRSDKEPIPWLLANRPRRDGQPTLGVNAAFPVEEEGKIIRVGDKVEITGEKEV